MPDAPTVYDEQGFSTFKMQEVEPRHGLQWFKGQVPNGLSGVTAGAYGDATHVGRFVVNQLGIIVAAANVPIGFPVAEDTAAGTTTTLSISEYATPDADQVSLAAGDNYIVYPHGLAGVPHSVRWVIVPQHDFAGWLAFEEIPIELFQFNLAGPSIGGARAITDTNLEFYCKIGISTFQKVALKYTWNETTWAPLFPTATEVYKLKAYAIL